MNIASPTYHQTIAQLDDAVDHFLKTGFVVISDPKVDPKADWATRRKQYREGMQPLPKAYVRKIVRKIAKELKRPSIVAEMAYYPNADGTITVRIKKLKRHAPLMTTFFLIEPSSHNNRKAQFHWANRATEWVLYFNGIKGREQFDEWMGFIQNSPECRKALKIPTPAGEADGASDVAGRGQNRLRRQEEGQALREGAAPDGARGAGHSQLAC